MKQDKGLGPQSFAVLSPWVGVARIQAASVEPQLGIMEGNAAPASFGCDGRGMELGSRSVVF